MPSHRPTVLHVTQYRLGRRQHPAIWRQILGLATHFRTVVVSGSFSGYFPDSHPDDDDVLDAAGVHVHRQDDLNTTLRHRSTVDALATALLRRHGQIHAIVGHLNSASRTVRLGERLGAPILATFHGDDANIELTSEAHGPEYARLKLAPAARFLAVSGNLAARLLTFGMPRERTLVHHLGIDLDGWPVPARSRPPGPLRVVMTGVLRRSKGHEMALRAFARYASVAPGASLHVVGPGPSRDVLLRREALAAMARDLGIEHAVRFHGAVPADVMPQLLARADVALQTSVFIPEERQIEGVPNAILEAMAMALPVVATRHGGIPEAVRHGQTGVLVEEHDIAGVAEALATLGRDPGLCARLGREGRRLVEAEFEARRQAARLARLVRETIADFHAGPHHGWVTPPAS